METHKKLRVHLSALADGELAPADVELAVACLVTPDGEQRWDLYHRIGDELRAQATPGLSDDFAARLKERLDTEPAPGRRAAKAVDAASARRSSPRASAPKRTARASTNAATAVKAVKAAKAGAKGASKVAADAHEAGDELPADAKAVVQPKPAIASVS